jgi:hypothetical protein
MWSLLHAAESFEDEPYVGGVLRILPLLNETSGRWSEILIIRILNSDSSRAELARQVKLAPDERKSALRSVCARLGALRFGRVRAPATGWTVDCRVWRSQSSNRSAPMRASPPGSSDWSVSTAPK